MKIAALALVTLFSIKVARADTVVVNLDATNAGYYDQFFGLVDLHAQLTMRLTESAGTFFDPGSAVVVIGPYGQPTPVYELTAISGTLNGNPISFFLDPNYGAGSWLWPNLTLGAIFFSVNGHGAWLENDVDYSLIALPTGGVEGVSTSPINYTTELVSTPEPGLLLTLPWLLLVLAVFVNERRKQTKVS